MATDSMTVKINPNDKANLVGKLADAELHFTDGPLEGTAIECPRHGARFDVRTGRPLCMPAVEPIATYEVKVVGNDILLRDRE